jgi:ryanodine receptor 2
MNYKPSPIDTSRVRLTPQLERLTETLAENAHDNWAVQRIKAGWQVGPARDDAKKLHPCLVPYDQLPESEKEYDRTSAMETLKVLVAMGYSIDKVIDGK